MQVYFQKSTRTTFPRRACAVRGGELSHAFARSRDANADGSAAWRMGRLWRNGTRTPVDVVGCDTVVSPRKPAIGAPTAMARTAPTRSLFVFIDECPAGLGSMLWRLEPSEHARRARPISERIAPRRSRAAGPSRRYRSTASGRFPGRGRGHYEASAGGCGIL